MSLRSFIASVLPARWRARLRDDWLPPALMRRLRPPQAVTEPPSEQSAAMAPLPERALDELFVVVETDAAEFFVGELFRRRYGTSHFPDDPRHYVGFYKGREGQLLPIGYVHHRLWQEVSLCGGLVIDDRRYRHIPAPDRERIRAAGGIAELMLRGSFALLPESVEAIWAHVGHAQSERVCLRVGYRHTDAPYVMVIWRRPFSVAEKAEWVRRIVDYGPF